VTLPRTPDEARAFLLGLPPSVMKLGLERVEAVLAALGNPEQRFPALHVAGTNGKGSTCAFAEACLRAGGYRTGLYTSPHLVRVNERIRVGGEEIPDAVLGQGVLEVLERAPFAAETLTFFEFGTVVAFWHFAQERVDVAVVEVGLGGRLDATRACRAEVTAVSAVSFDHEAQLGNTLDAIAGEKAGIFRAGIPAVSAAQAPEAWGRISRVAAEVGAPLLREGAHFGLGPAEEGGFTFHGPGDTRVDGLRLALPGPHQQHNAALALAALGELGRRGFPLSPEALREGLASARWPGRMERLLQRPGLWVDGAHNPAGVEALAAAVRQLLPGRPLQLVFGVLGDKAWPAMVERLFPLASGLHLGRVESPRALAPDAPGLLEAAGRAGLWPAVYPSVAAAVEGALGVAGEEGEVLACGSLVLVGEVHAWVQAQLEAGRLRGGALS